MSDATKARTWLESAARYEPNEPATMAVMAQAHATLALHDRLGAILERLMGAPHAPRRTRVEQERADEAAIRAAVLRQDADGIRQAVDERNRRVQEATYDTSQYAESPTAAERTWVEENEIREVEAVEAQIDPDVAASNAAARRAAREERALDREVASGGIFGQMRPREDG